MTTMNNNYVRRIQYYKKLNKKYLLATAISVFIAIISVSLSVYCLYDRYYLVDKIIQQQDDIDRYKAELANFSRKEIEQDDTL